MERTETNQPAAAANQPPELPRESPHELEASAGVRPATRRAALFEIVCLLVLIEIIMWVVPLFPHPKLPYAGFAVLILMLLLVAQWRDGAAPRDLGFRLDNFGASLEWVAVRLAPFFLIVLVVGAISDSLHFGDRFLGMLVSVPLWALLQQYMLLGFLHRRLRQLTGSRRLAIACSTLIFAAMHLPNPMLTVACAVAGAVWAWAYECRPNLFANALTHTIGSALVANSLPHWLLKNMVVGYNHFFR